MNYYIQGNKDKVAEIKDAFEKLGYDVRESIAFGAERLIMFTMPTDNKLRSCAINSDAAYLITRLAELGDYKELELPVEPKFKVGDWIACDADSFTLSIKSVKDGDYYFHQGASLPIKDIDEHYHLWSIKDAKDGDVLVSGIDNPFIYDGNIEFSSAGAYVGVSRNGRIRLDMFPSKAWTSIKGVKPATKELRGMLFKKMKEAGYEWDADKKELKKIQSHYDVANFQPFDKVLVRQNDSSTWGVSFFGRFDEMFMCCSNVWYHQCIPFNEKTKHLLGTTDMPSEEYINW